LRHHPLIFLFYSHLYTKPLRLQFLKAGNLLISMKKKVEYSFQFVARRVFLLNHIKEQKKYHKNKNVEKQNIKRKNIDYLQRPKKLPKQKVPKK
jgi:hypothetical protein